jgi:pimeloyl-ACP methyl ester carboxylesterase
VTFPGGAEGVTLAGELTMPREGGPFPTLIMITGSGPQTRDEEISGHKVFLVLSDFLTKRGFAVLRYDDRGVGESTGDFTTATTEDFALDAAAAMRWLKAEEHIDTSRAGYVGHSEGGWIAPLAVQTEDAAFMVLLAGPAENIVDTVIRQNADMPRAEGKSGDWVALNVSATQGLMDIFKSARTPDEAHARALAHYARYQKKLGLPANQLEASLELVPPAWWIWAVKYDDPLPALRAFEGPVLAVFGEKDTQVSASANAPIMEDVLSNDASTVLTLPGLNHLFQPSKTGAISEYWRIRTTFDESAMEATADWLESLPDGK